MSREKKRHHYWVLLLITITHLNTNPPVRQFIYKLTNPPIRPQIYLFITHDMLRPSFPSSLSPHEYACPSLVNAMACLPPGWTAIFVTFRWLRDSTCRGMETFSTTAPTPSLPCVHSPHEYTLPSYVTQNNVFEPPTMSLHLIEDNFSHSWGALICGGVVWIRMRYGNYTRLLTSLSR